MGNMFASFFARFLSRHPEQIGFNHLEKIVEKIAVTMKLENSKESIPGDEHVRTAFFSELAVYIALGYEKGAV